MSDETESLKDCLSVEEARKVMERPRGLKIEKNIPIPPRLPLCNPSKWKVVVETWNEGDSVMFHTKDFAGDRKAARKQANALQQYAKKWDQKVAIRTVDGGFRAWFEKQLPIGEHDD